MADEDKAIRVVIAHEPPAPMSRTEKAFTFLMFLAMIWAALPPRKRRG